MKKENVLTLAEVSRGEARDRGREKCEMLQLFIQKRSSRALLAAIR